MWLHVVQDKKIKYKEQKMRDKLINSDRCCCIDAIDVPVCAEWNQMNKAAIKMCSRDKCRNKY